MSNAHIVGSREEWLAARPDLLEVQEYSGQADDLARRRQRLPWVQVDKEHDFDTDRGRVPKDLRWALATPNLPRHVRTRLESRLPFLLDARGLL
jgi:hypothetical protein